MSNPETRRSDHNNQGGTRPAPNGADLELQRRDERNILELYRAAFIGDWDSARGILEQDAEAINARITGEEDTALHIAAAAGHTYFVRQLVNKMSENNLDLGLTNGSGNTAFCLAAVSGIVEVAEVMMGRNRELAKTRGKENMLPLEMAVSSGQRKMARYLYDATKDQLNDSDQKNLFVMLVDVGMYDIARQMLQADSNLAIAQDRNHETALHVLTRKPLVERRRTAEDLIIKMKNSIEAIASLGVMKAMSQMVEFYMYGVQKNEALGFVKDLWAEAVLLDHSIISSLIGLPGRLLFTAAEQGNSEFLKIVIRSYPDVVFKVDEHQRSIFHISVLHRHENVFELIHDLGPMKNLIVEYKDDEGNNMLHLAAKLGPRSRLDLIPGAALQMQYELLWFEEVKKIVAPLQIEAKNSRGETPGSLFTTQHEDLRKEGEKWMKENANSLMLVAALIATVVFAAAFTLPGGLGNGTGIPVFLHSVAFKIFSIADTVAMVSSVSWVLIFLSVLISRFAERDFLRSLPSKLIGGLLMLVISVLAMMVAFFAAFYLLFSEGQLMTFAIPIAVVGSYPVLLSIVPFLDIFGDTIFLTYKSNILFLSEKTPTFTEKLIRKFVTMISRLSNELIR